MFKQVRDFGLEALPFLGKFTLGTVGTTPPQFGLLGGELFPHRCHGPQGRLVQVFQNMELANLMRQTAPHSLNRDGIQG